MYLKFSTKDHIIATLKVLIIIAAIIVFVLLTANK